jgi:hypothetical protein
MISQTPKNDAAEEENHAMECPENKPRRYGRYQCMLRFRGS